MIRRAFTMRLKPGMLAPYKESHDNVWPELVRDMMKVSDNAWARTLFLSLGSLQGDETLGSRPLPAGQRLAMLMAARLRRSLSPIR